MNLMEIFTIANTAFVMLIFLWKIVESKERDIDLKEIEEKIEEKIDLNLDVTNKNFAKFFKAVEIEYTKSQLEIIHKLKETEEVIKKIKDEELAFEKINKSLENRVIESQKHIAMLQKKLDKCNKKVRLQKEKIE